MEGEGKEEGCIYLITHNILVTGNMGSLNSINFPTNYSNNYEEHYVITVEDGAKISLYFENFDLEYHISCIYDYIEGKGSGTMDGTMVLLF